MPITPQQLLERKQQGLAIVALTAYDYVSAKLLDRAGVDLLLVGDHNQHMAPPTTVS